MLGKHFILILVLLLILSSATFVDRSAESESRTITVPDEYSTIQAAVNVANAGDTVFVRSGTYSEHVVVDKTISVTGEDASTTVIDGNDAGTVARVTADGVSVNGFTIRNGEVGLDLLGDGANVSGSIFTSNGLVNTDLKTDLEVYQDPLSVVWHRHYDLIEGSYTELYQITTETPVLSVGVFGHTDVDALMLGIFCDENMDGIPQLHEFLGFASVDLNTWVCVFDPPLGQYIIKVHGFAVSGNPGHFDRRITTYRGSGIAVHSSSNSIISENVVNDNYAGVFIQSSTNVSVHSNNITQNIGGIVSSTSTNSVLSDNRVFSNDPDYSFGTGIALRDVGNTTVAGNLLSHNSFGINVWNSSGINVEENQLEWHNGWAVELHGSVDNNVANNNVTEVASLDGIRLMFSSRNNLTRNNLTNCEHSGILYWYDNFNNSATLNNLQFSGIHHYLDGHGVEVLLSANNTFTHNTFANGNNQGFLAIESNSTAIVDNLVESNRKGIVLRSSTGNHVYHNSIVNNSEQQAYDDTAQNFWSDGYPSGGNFWSDYGGNDTYSGTYQNETGSDGIGDTPYIFDANNRDNYPVMKQFPWNQHDVGITSLSTSKSICGQGYLTNVSIMMFNYGDFAETFNVTAYANTTSIWSRNIPLTSRNSTTITFTWNTTGFAYGNYTLSAYVIPVTEEIDMSDNNYNCTIPVHIGVPGDVSSSARGVYDKKCDMKDIAYLVSLFNTKPASPNWNPNADVDNNSVVNMRDIAIAIAYFNQHE